jgi:hypothetical protein
MNGYDVIVFAAHRLAPRLRHRACGLAASAVRP